MKPLNTLFKMPKIFSTLSMFAILFTAFLANAQTPQLSLADLLIGLRSQKVTLPERNKILTAAVRERGITFAYTPEIAKELEATGAGPELLAAVRSMGSPKPVATPTPPDHTFYQRRASENAVKGDYKLALADYNKAAEMRSDDFTILLGRGRTHFNLRSYDLSVADYNKALELAPNESSVYYNRGASFERMGELANAMADYTKAVVLDEKNEAARSSLNRLQDEIAKIEALRIEAEEKAKADAAAEEAAKEAKRKAVEQKAAAPPEYLHVGTLTSANATRMTMPQYPQLAARSRIEGRVTVQVEINEKGEVTKADAVDGPQMLRGPAEDAAKRSRFQPFLFNGTPIKARGVIIYNFNLKAEE